MKYFKYNKMGKVQALADKRLLDSLNALESKKIIRNRRMQLLISVFVFIIFLVLFGFLLIKQENEK